MTILISISIWIHFETFYFNHKTNLNIFTVFVIVKFKGPQTTVDYIYFTQE